MEHSKLRNAGTVETESRALRQTLQQPDVHDQWEHDFRTPENDRYYDRAFDYIATQLEAPEGATLLDAGCGICEYSMRLARRGFRVVAVDFSESVLQNAQANLDRHGMSDRLLLQRDDLLDLSFEDESFDYGLCWGVLMHIPDVETAVSELARVIKPGGMLVVSEGNRSSLESVLRRRVARRLVRRTSTSRWTAAGLEHWAETSAGRLLTREADIGWLIRRFQEREFTVHRRVAGQFTELYTRMSPGGLQRFVHGFNRFWFDYVRIPRLAQGNILILRKRT